jgi:predicted O-methyltransferase YrrM
MTSEEAALLYQLAQDAAGGCIVEIGSFHGKSTVALALGARAGHRPSVHAVDPFVPFTGALGGEFSPADKTVLLRNLLLAGVAEQVYLLHTTSVQAARGWREPIALLWIDGDHTYAGVRADLAAWDPFVVPGGRIAFHDSVDPTIGPSRIIAEILAAGTHTRVQVAGTITVLRKAGSG